MPRSFSKSTCSVHSRRRVARRAFVLSARDDDDDDDDDFESESEAGSGSRPSSRSGTLRVLSAGKHPRTSTSAVARLLAIA
mmetsp:Transcript_99381/g.280445  ORF Transcript_99381/g.280445 Transcript_99381/m.280445 type:complete len:81 (+) Transcript_99381:653-895(+)